MSVFMLTLTILIFSYQPFSNARKSITRITDNTVITGKYHLSSDTRVLTKFYRDYYFRLNMISITVTFTSV